MNSTELAVHAKTNERKQWFLARIGKRVFRPKTSCTCSSCKDVYENGLVIQDEMQAVYLYDIEGSLGIRYCDSKEEVEECENYQF